MPTKSKRKPSTPRRRTTKRRCRPAPCSALVLAAERADWMQVVLNQGPPCFHLEGRRFCLRAARWAGHDEASPLHKYVSLADLLRGVVPNAELCRGGESGDGQPTEER